MTATIRKKVVVQIMSKSKKKQRKPKDLEQLIKEWLKDSNEKQKIQRKYKRKEVERNV